MHERATIVIAGTGLLGASLALALKAAGHTGRIVGVGRRPETLERARAVGGFDDTSTDLGAAAAKAQLAVLATPLSAFDRLLAELSTTAPAGLIVTDVGSTKVGPLAAARRHLPPHVRFVGAHPMAGSERQGPEAADAELFRGRPCIVCRETDTDDRAAATVAAMWERVGMTVLEMTAEQHDRKTAAVSHLPHAAAVALVLAADQLGGWDVASTGFRDTTRLASSNPPMRRDIMLENRHALRDAIATFRHELDRLEEHLAAGDGEALLQHLDAARRERDDWLGDEPAKRQDAKAPRRQEERKGWKA